MSIWSAFSVVFYPSRSNFSVSCSQQWINTLAWNGKKKRVSHLLSFFEDFFTYSVLGWTQDFLKWRQGRRERGEKPPLCCFFKSEEKLVCAKVSFPTICWCSRRYFLCTCFSPVLSLALLQCHNHQKETSCRNSWLRGGKLRLELWVWIGAQPDLFHPSKGVLTLRLLCRP